MKPVLVILRLFWTSHKLRFSAGFAMAAITLIAALALLGLSGWFITVSAILGLAGAGLALDIFTPSAGIRGLALLRTVGRYGERFLTHDATLAFLVVLRRRLFDAFSRRDFKALGRLRSGEVLARITADVDSLDAIYLRLFVPIAGAALIILVTFAALVLFAPSVALPVFVLVAAGFAATVVAGLFLARVAGRREALAREAVRVRLIDLTRGLVELHLAGRAGAQADAVLAADRVESHAARAANRVEAGAAQALFLVTHIGLGLALYLGIGAVAGGALTPPILALAVIAVLGLGEAMGLVVRGVVGFGRTELAARRLAPMLDENDVVPGPAPGGEPETGLISARGLAVGWAAQHAPVLTEVDLDVSAGDRIALAGPSGAGKSTLLLTLAGLIPPLDGQLAVAQNIRVAYVPQRSALFADSIAGNLRLADPGADDAALWAALDRVHLGDVVRALPGGLDSMLGEGGRGLSGGQQRRLVLARASLMRPDIFLLDEPTEGLGRDQGAAVLKALMNDFPDAGFVVATHRDDEMQLFARTLRVTEGGLVRHGSVTHVGS